MQLRKSSLSKLTSRKQIKEKSVKNIFFLCAIFGGIVIFSILVFLVKEAYPLPTDLWTFLTNIRWNPTGEPEGYGSLPLSVGTLLVTLGAMLIAVPLSIGSAIFISEIASVRFRSILKPAIELLAGIPSVVFGFFGLIILTDWIKVNFGVPTGETWLAGSIILGVMAIPTITTVADDAINAVPREYKEGSTALGATRWQTISWVVLPSALSGITAAIILGIGRAVGETMAILMVCGNSSVIPSPLWNVFSSIRTLTSTLGIEMGEVALGGPHYHALFGVAVLLLVMTLVINISAVYALGKLQQRHIVSEKKAKKSLIPYSISQKIKQLFIYSFIGFLIMFFYLVGGIILAFVVVLLIAIFAIARKRMSAKSIQKFAFSLLGIAIIIVLMLLGIILGYIITQGIGAMNWEFISAPHRSLGRQGGVFTAILGTLYLVAGAIAIAFPIGVGAAIYLTEYTREGRLTKIIRSAADLLNGTPSIVFGLFGLAFFVLYLRFGFSLLAGQITLAFMIIPTILRTTEEALRSVPQAIREGSYAVGATKWQTIRRVVLPPAFPGILTGAVLGIGRAAGETAPIMFTAVTFSAVVPSSVLQPVNALPYHLFILATTIPGPEARQAAGGAALVLLLLVIVFYSIAILMRSRFQKTMKW